MTATPLPVVIAGAAGRVGRRLVALVRASDDLLLRGATVRAGSAHAGADAGDVAGSGHAGVALSESLEAALDGAAVAIDFSAPEATALHARLCARRGVALVVGTTALGPAQETELRRAAERIAVVASPNMSVGVNLLFGLARRAAAALDAAWDLEIVEAHHRRKKDAPSGTAMRLAAEIAAGRGLDPARAVVTGRAGIATGERPRDEIAVLALRGGDVVGEHTAYFLAEGERLELTHRATDRDIFARGALRAARWTAAPGRAAGLYDMADVLGLK